MSHPLAALRPYVLTAMALLTGLLVLVAPSPALGAAGSGPGDTEAVIAQRFADERARAGLAAVPRSAELDAVARDWAHRQAADGQMKHNPNLRDQVQPAKAWYENVGFVRGVPSSLSYRDAGARLHEMWMGSDGHRANILRSPLTDVGFGVASNGDEVYATVVFRDQGAPAPAPEPSPSPSPSETPAESSRATTSTASTQAAPAAKPAATAEPAPERAPEPEPEPAADEPEEPEELRSIGPPGDLAERLERRAGADRPADGDGAAPQATATPGGDDEPPPPIELQVLPDAGVGLPVGDGGPRSVPLILGLATIAGAVVVGAARPRRPGR
ncbi:CAP domain-containing protein [Nitriliruptor alkaliphilus]|uniref:CAP domain-containing protein n=1 Tax=Nitriliruptor alkaliphilus TaxID=427918 RepID=UPI00069608E3|nr:CAP domain-containing protein [Nitriliruptor alkaliphilus]